MNIYLVLVSFSVIYSKYNYYCYEVPEDKPVRYFDGNDWRIMKQRSIMMPKRVNNISIEINSAEIIDFFNETDIDCNITTTNTSTNYITTTKKTTTKKTTTKIIQTTSTTKATTKATTQNWPSICVLKKISTTKKAPGTSIKAVNTNNPTAKTTKKTPPKINKKPSAKTTKKPLVRMYRNPAVIATKNLPVRMYRNPAIETIKKPAATLKKPARTAKQPVKTTKKSATKATTKRPAKFHMGNFAKPVMGSGPQPATTSHDDLISAMKDLIETLKTHTLNKTITPYENKTTTPDETTSKLTTHSVLFDGRRAMNGIEDIMNLLTDGVEIDDRPEPSSYSDESDYYQGMLEDKEVKMDLDTIDRILNGDNQKHITKKRELTLNENNIENVKSYLDAVKDRYDKDVYGDFQGNEDKTFLNMLKSTVVKKDSTQDINKSIDFDAIKTLLSKENLGPSEFREQSEDEHNFQRIDSYSDLNSILARVLRNRQNNLLNSAIRKSLNSINLDAPKNSTQDEAFNLDKNEDLVTPKHTDAIETDQTNDTDTMQDVKSYLKIINSRYLTKDRDLSKDKQVINYLNAIKNIYMTNEAPPYNELASILNALEIRRKSKDKDRMQNEDLTLDTDAMLSEDVEYDDDLRKSLDVEENDATREGTEYRIRGTENGEMLDYEVVQNVIEEKGAEANEFNVDEDFPFSYFKYPLADEEQTKLSKND